MKQEDELDRLEEDIRRLKNRYDQFFMGIQRMPPMTERRVLESFIYELGKQKMRDNARRFRYQNLLTRYNQFREVWARKMREREEGPVEFRKRRAAMEEPAAPPAPPSPAETRAEARVTSPPDRTYVKVAAGSNGEGVRKLYDQIEKEHMKMGKLPSISFDQLRSMVEKQSELVRAKYHVNTVAFRVETVDGKVRLKAKPLQD
ncbi:MAG TPA: MXAN_5187 C-terminal domain-containing protein [Thermoanaerobaculia bacterium]|nr:MXAN_5187 C-terminal domain-containing protein [Thermoanaerobaculia bacterium]